MTLSHDVIWPDECFSFSAPASKFAMTEKEYDEVTADFGQEFCRKLKQRHVRAAVQDDFTRSQNFKDAVAGLQMLNNWHGDEIASLPAAEIEVRRALHAANLSAELFGCARSHQNWEDANCGYTDGAVLRQLMFAAGIAGDWFFVPMLAIASGESFHEFA